MRECVHIRLRARAYKYKLLLTEKGKSGNIFIDVKYDFHQNKQENKAL